MIPSNEDFCRMVSGKWRHAKGGFYDWPLIAVLLEEYLELSVTPDQRRTDPLVVKELIEDIQFLADIARIHATDYIQNSNRWN